MTTASTVRRGEDLLVRIDGTTVTLAGHFLGYTVEKIEFADGTLVPL